MTHRAVARECKLLISHDEGEVGSVAGETRRQRDLVSNARPGHADGCDVDVVRGGRRRYGDLYLDLPDAEGCDLPGCRGDGGGPTGVNAGESEGIEGVAGVGDPQNVGERVTGVTCLRGQRCA